MLDLKLIRSEPERVKEALARRGAAEEIDELLRLDARRRELLPLIEGGRAEQNQASKAIAEAKRSGEEATDAITEMRELSGRLKKMQSELAEVEEARERLAVSLPNLPDPDESDGRFDTGDPDFELMRRVVQDAINRDPAAAPPVVAADPSDIPETNRAAEDDTGSTAGATADADATDDAPLTATPVSVAQSC